MKSLKRILAVLLIMLSVSGIVYAKSNNDIKATSKQTVPTTPQVLFDGTAYKLKYSTNKTQSGEYMNEYYTDSETPTDWTERITVCEYPKYPNKTMDYAESVLSRDNSPNNYDRPLSTSSKTEKVTFVFLLAGKTDDYKYMEFNVMQVLPYKNYKGLKTVQFSKKYKYTTREEFKSAYDKMESDKQKYFGLVRNMEMPVVIHETIE